MKKLFIGISVFLLFSLTFMPNLSADVGPKPSGVIEVTGIDEAYDLDILIPYRFSSPPRVMEEESWKSDTHYLDDDFFTVFERINGFITSDRYASATLYSGPPRYIDREDDFFTLGYFGAPKDFKIAIITESGHLIISEPVRRQLFDAHFTYDLSGVDLENDQVNAGVVEEEVPWATMVGQYFLRVFLTIAVELLILFLFFYRLKKSYLLAGFVNLFTQSFLTIFVLLGYYFWGGVIAALLLLILGEIIIITLETIIYVAKLKEKSRLRAFSYSIVANLVTLAIGFVLILI